MKKKLKLNEEYCLKLIEKKKSIKSMVKKIIEIDAAVTKRDHAYYYYHYVSWNREPITCYLCKNENDEDVIKCKKSDCNKVYHESCCTKCPIHYCFTCMKKGERNKSVYKCNSCFMAYCEDHLPEGTQMGIYKDIWCEKCMEYRNSGDILK